MRALDSICSRLLQILVCAALLLPAISAADESRTQRDLETMRRHYKMTQPERRGEPALELQLRDREGWRKLRVGMSEAEVEKWLGKPDRIEDVEGATRWHYHREHDKGWVSFTRDAHTVLEWRYF
jgi:outer membrane protein assembly factor BamE (lipoprotein component of BamABCDE complex)